MRVHGVGDVGAEAVAPGAVRSGGDRPSGDLRLPRPVRLGALDRVNRGAVQGEPWIPAQIRALARAGHGAEHRLAALEGRLDPGDPRRPAGAYGGDCLCR
jgi:hypothetical protein